jgi:hypothetical protein
MASAASGNNARRVRLGQCVSYPGGVADRLRQRQAIGADQLAEWLSGAYSIIR